MAKIVIDAGHGGEEPGAVYQGRKEKDDNLALALEVGRILEDNGTEVVFTRTEDVYQTPFEKAQLANEADADYVVSFHRNSSPEDNQYFGVETLVYNHSGKKVEMAEAINRELEELGFRNIGVKERPGLVILRRTKAPAILIETGFLNTDRDNELFDTKFDDIAQAIANGILETAEGRGIGSGGAENDEFSKERAGESEFSRRSSQTGESELSTGEDSSGGTEFFQDRQRDSGSSMAGESTGQENAEMTRDRLYQVQTGAFRNPEYAQDMVYQLSMQGYPVFLLQEDGLFKVRVGAFRQLDNAVKMETALRSRGYSTFIAH